MMLEIKPILLQLKTSTQWDSYQAIKHLIPTALHGWLIHRASFISRLRKFGVIPFIEIVQQQWQKPSRSEAVILNLPTKEYALIREVNITCGQHVWMTARSVFPRRSLVGKNKLLSVLKTRSLGSVLFKEPHLQRGEFNFQQLEQGVWARRSLFWLQKKPILVHEVFSPRLAELLI